MPSNISIRLCFYFLLHLIYFSLLCIFCFFFISLPHYLLIKSFLLYSLSPFPRFFNFSFISYHLFVFPPFFYSCLFITSFYFIFHYCFSGFLFPPPPPGPFGALLFEYISPFIYCPINLCYLSHCHPLFSSSPSSLISWLIYVIFSHL